MPPDATTQLIIEAVAKQKFRKVNTNAQDHLLDFCTETYSGYHRAEHLVLVAEALEDIESGANDRLIIELPPRHGKSELVSVRFPAWLLGRQPTRSVISASYGDELAHEMGRRARNVVETQHVFPEVRLAADSKAKNLWHTQQGGQFLAVGIGSGVVGFGGDIILIDDPYKKREEAESERHREHIWNWYTSEILTRQEPNAAIVLIMHRWHEDDLSGRVQEAEPGRWKLISLPAIAEGDDLLGRKPGQALWPWRYDEEALEQRRTELGNDRDWYSLYQQRPAPDEGLIFKWFPRFHNPGILKQIILPIDTAYTDTSGSDYTAWTAWGFDGQKAYALDADRYKGEVPEAERIIIKLYQDLRRMYSNIPIKPLVRQAVAIDRIIGQHLREAGLPVVEVKMPSNTKKEMAKIVSANFESGRALVPSHAIWLSDWMAEHKAFDTGKHDDWVETTNIALWYLFRSRPWKRPTERVEVWG